MFDPRGVLNDERCLFERSERFTDLSKRISNTHEGGIAAQISSPDDATGSFPE